MINQVKFIVKVLTFATMSLLIVSCKEREDKGKFKIIPITLIDKINLSELIESDFEYIPLQTYYAPLIGSINKIISTDSAYFVLDSQFSKQVMRFNKNGIFINTYGNVGEANGEYLTPSEIIVHGNSIEVIDGSNFSVLKFELNGDFKDEFRIPYWVNEAIQLDDDTKLVYCPTDYSPDGKLDMGVLSIISDDFRKIEQTFFPYEEVLDDAPFPGYLTQYGNQFTYVKTVLGEFYTIDENKQIMPRFKIDFGKHKWPIDVETIKLDIEKTEEVFFKGGIMSAVHRLNESGDYLTFRTLMIDAGQNHTKINESRDQWFCILDKANERLYAIKQIINDIDGGTFPLPLAVEKNNFLGIISSEQLLNTSGKNNLNASSPEHYNSLKALKDSLNISSNPIIMRYRLKSNLIIK